MLLVSNEKFLDYSSVTLNSTHKEFIEPLNFQGLSVKHPSSNNNQFKPNKARTSVFYYDLFSEK
jgi:hypothetical protein